MSTFPLLNTGAVAQYPAGATRAQQVELIRFLDGGEQRFSTQGRVLRRWQIHLNLLNEDEMQALESFFAAQLGPYSSFSFPDPFSGSVVANCRFASDVFSSEYDAADVGGTSFWVIETNG
jgi:hypothetical protein